MELAPIQILMLFSTLHCFHYYHTLHIKNFRGASQGFLFYLNIYTLIVMLAKYGFIGYWWWRHGWQEALSLFVIAQLSGVLAIVLETITPLSGFYISMLGLIAGPFLLAALWYLGLST